MKPANQYIPLEELILDFRDRNEEFIPVILCDLMLDKAKKVVNGTLIQIEIKDDS